MSDDIVARLREFDADLTQEIQNGEHGDDGHLWVIPYDCIVEAADEIERLRAGGCARDQKITQYCAEAVALQREVERLREALRIEQEELAACCIDRKETQRERDEARRERDGYLEGNRQTLAALAEANEIAKKYKAERDEARWRLCKVVGDNRGVWGCEIAKENGWDYLATEDKP